MGRDKKNAQPALEVTGQPVEGTVKWFDNGKGRGFIEVPGYQDVFVHMTAVRCAGLTGLREKDRVRFELAYDKRDSSRTLAINLEMLKTKSDAHSARPSGRVTGTIKWFNHKEGIGFIAQDAGGPDVFVGDKTVPPEILPHLAEGKRVSFVQQAGRDGRVRAAELQLA